MTESLSKISSIFETAKDFTIEAAVSASSRLAETPSASRPQEITKLLNSRVDKDVLNGMKCVISMMSRDEDVLDYFADIVKNITSGSRQVRNLVLIYIAKYAEVEPDTALLSINSIQKSLSDKDPVSRSNAIKAMSSIKIAPIGPILQLCIKRTVSDKSPLVRATTALAISKVYGIDKPNSKQLLEHLGKLIGDNSPQVVGAAIKSFVKIMEIHESMPKKWQLIHGQFRRVCRIIEEFDEWAQAITIDLLTDYCRTFLPKPDHNIQDFSSIDSDLQLFINCLKPLVFTDSPFILVAICRALLALSPNMLNEFGIPSSLCAMTSDTSNSPIRLFSLQLCSFICEHDRSGFVPHFKRFFIFPADTFDIASTKLGILSSLVDESNIKYILEELEYNALNSNDFEIAAEAIKAIGRCSSVSDIWNSKILKWCLRNIKRASGRVLNELLTIVRYLIQIQQQLNNSSKEISKVVYNLSLILNDKSLYLEPDARASIIWIIGEFTKECDNEIAPDVLRILLVNFSNEAEKVRYQILILAAKLYSISIDEFTNSHENKPDVMQEFHDGIISKMFNYVLTLSKFDQSFDTRDRARMMNFLLNSNSDTSQLASLFLQVPKPAPIVRNLTNNMHAKVLVKHMRLPDWSDPATLPKADIRNSLPIQENKVSSFSSISLPTKSIKIDEINHGISTPQINIQKQYQLQSLDEFFGSDEEGEELDDEEGEEDDEDEDEDEEEEEEDEEEEDDEDEDEEEEEDDEDGEDVDDDEHEDLVADKKL